MNFTLSQLGVEQVIATPGPGRHSIVVNVPAKRVYHEAREEARALMLQFAAASWLILEDDALHLVAAYDRRHTDQALPIIMQIRACTLALLPLVPAQYGYGPYGTYRDAAFAQQSGVVSVVVDDYDGDGWADIVTTIDWRGDFQAG